MAETRAGEAREKGTRIIRCVRCDEPAKIRGLYTLNSVDPDDPGPVVDMVVDEWYCLSCWAEVRHQMEELHGMEVLR